MLAALGALALLVSLFLTWYQPSRDAWTVFELNDLVLAALGLLVLAISAFDVIGSWSLRYLSDSSVPYAGVGALIIVVATLIQAPPAAAHSSPQVGAWFALGGALAITLGGLLLKARVSVVITLRPPDRDRTHAKRDEYAGDYPEDEPTETRPQSDDERG